jgi:hypothetical protein
VDLFQVASETVRQLRMLNGHATQRRHGRCDKEPLPPGLMGLVRGGQFE